MLRRILNIIIGLHFHLKTIIPKNSYLIIMCFFSVSSLFAEYESVTPTLPIEIEININIKIHFLGGLLCLFVVFALLFTLSNEMRARHLQSMISDCGTPLPMNKTKHNTNERANVLIGL